MTVHCSWLHWSCAIQAGFMFFHLFGIFTSSQSVTSFLNVDVAVRRGGDVRRNRRICQCDVILDCWCCSKAWWRRQKKSTYLPAISLEDKNFVQYLQKSNIYQVSSSSLSFGTSHFTCYNAADLVYQPCVVCSQGFLLLAVELQVAAAEAAPG